MQHIPLNSDRVQAILNFHCPRFHELPSIDLYADQVVQLVQDILEPLGVNSSDKVITKAIINNYVKQRVISPPRNKLYNQHQLAWLIVVCMFKRTLSISNIAALLQLQDESSYTIETSYDYFCSELENALKSVFLREENIPEIFTERTIQTDLVRSMVLVFANEIYIQQCIFFSQEQKMEEKE